MNREDENENTHIGNSGAAERMRDKGRAETGQRRP